MIWLGIAYLVGLLWLIGEIERAPSLPWHD